MWNLTGYQLREQLYESANSRVYRAWRKADNCAVILKVLRDEYPSPERIAWFKREYEVTLRLDMAEVVDVLRLEKVQNRWVMVLEDFGGDSLRRLGLAGGLALDEFLSLAIKMSDILGKVHQRQIIHKDINPANILFNPITNSLKLVLC